ncbi:transglutaminaseTgpA domain-containing protein [Micromonospora sp. WMMD882]|uniref:transglutaminaseTgpA domain-containing protein n=1 Tax=Micromonospora sp. WMMD882 TaxID=3015151 RepID=UPI00248C05D1|nr:transglutaminaseTgpA domain-containing protein [Micromonospora sp. WMMD882]WBB80011.1 transglutaminaseTgpA domain-containing protein [Micromonospora sp. WMMD882]
MIANRSLGLVAAVATLLAAAPLSAIFQRWTWLVQATIAVAVVAGVAALLRMVRAPLWGQALGMTAGLLLALTWMFPGGGELAGVLPTPTTLGYFGELVGGSVQDMRSYGVKVPDTEPLLFITVLGVGSVAVLVDLLVVGLRRPALAGLPMLAIYSVPVAVYVDSVPPVPFVIGAAGYLWLLVSDNIDRVRRFGRRFTGDGRDVDVWESSPLASAGRRLAVVGVVAAVLVPLAVPGMTSGLLDRLHQGTGNGAGGTGVGGNSGRVDLFAALSGQLNQSEVADLVKVTTNEPDPFYLRFGVADELRPDGFRVRNPAGRPVDRDLPDPTREVDDDVRHRRYQARVEVTDDLDMRLMPVYADPVRVDGLNGNWLYDSNLQVVFSKRESSRGKRYEFDYVRARYTPELLRRAESLPPDDGLVQRLTDTPQAPEVDDLVDGLVADEDNDYDRVRAIYDHFSVSNGFSYSLRTEGGTSGKDIVDFLTNKVGFCQQYAAAMAWMVRAAGIPARVAFGFTNGTSRDEDSYVLTNRNLHAWTEVYFDGFGWVPFDATPAYGVPGNTRSDWAPDIDAPDPSAPSAGATPLPGGADPSSGPTGPDDPDRNIDEGLVPNADAPTRQAPAWPWWTAAGILVLLGLLALPALRRVALRRRRSAPPPAAPVTPTVAGAVGSDDSAGRMVILGADADQARALAHAAWNELLDTLLDYRVRVDRTETPRATAERLAREALAQDDPAASAARLLGRAEERARYARDPLAGGELPGALGTVRRALGAQADRRTRFVATTLPPSVLLRWRTALTDTSTRLVTATGRLRTRLLRWNPRRLLAGRPAR